MKEVINKEKIGLTTSGTIQGAFDVFGKKPKKSSEEIIVEAAEKGVSTIDIADSIDVFAKPKIDNLKEVQEPVGEAAEQDVAKQSEDIPTEDLIPQGSEDLVTLSDESSVEEISEEQEDIVDNIFYHIAHELKDKKELPEDLDISEDINGSEVYNAYRDSLEKSASAEIEQRVMQQLGNVYTDTTLTYAKLIAEGTDINLLQEANRIKLYSDLELDKTDDKEKLSVISEYYKDRGFKEREIERVLSDIEIEEIDINEVATEAKEHFIEKYDAIIAEEQEANQARAEQVKQQETLLRQTINTIVDSGEVNGIPIPDRKDFKRAIYTQDKIVTINNQDYQVSDLDIFRYEMDNNPEVFMSTFMQWLYKDKISNQIEEAAKEKAEEELLSGYRKSVEKSQRQLKKQQLADSIKKQTGGKKTLVLNRRGAVIK